MRAIRKIKGNLYFEGNFSLRNRDENWACPVDFPTIFRAYGRGVRSGNWTEYTSINIPGYVIERYLYGDISGHEQFWNIASQLFVINNWANIDAIPELIKAANIELQKFKPL